MNTILTPHSQLGRLDRWHRGETQLFTAHDYAALEREGLLAQGGLGGYVLTKVGRELLLENGLLRTILTGAKS